MTLIHFNKTQQVLTKTCRSPSAERGRIFGWEHSCFHDPISLDIKSVPWLTVYKYAQLRTVYKVTMYINKVKNNLILLTIKNKIQIKYA